MSANSPVRAAVPLIPSPKRESGYCVGPAAQLIARDIGEIHSRLLDHRPVIQGETRYFIKEFESNPSPKVRLEKLRSQWEAFMKEDEQQRLAIDEEQNKAVLRLKEQYAQMDKELSKMAPF
ncbi:hypothetical protein GDO78_012768 [Eleutherodactylus coqui]|uniref:Biogenesis of lysosome-related organelles complex 1 subunit 5 n=1 Tax=Eleutherodactylus coqui TaxID=57060 RepID=A0A8J6F2N8_ELECQ|nr:hypothetical protein GDO78_012768 [Eleutherodactylus coqui]